jgi:uncharacterized protein YqhQ
MPTDDSTPRPYIGGQAVLEGVMMRAPKSFAIVVRRRDGSLLVRERPMAETRRGLGRLPLVRGVASLVESLKLGSEALRFSAEQFEKDLAAEEQAAKAPKGPGVLSSIALTLHAMATAEPEEPPQGSPHQPREEPKEVEAKKKGSYTMILMLVIVIGFFIALPQAAADALNRWLGLGLGLQSPAFQAITGAFKLAIVVGYLVAIRRVPDIRRVFQYHGAEHKTISTYEAGEELTIANARKKTTLHPRCGTTFLVMVALVSILVFTGMGGLLPRIATGSRVLDNVVFFAEKLPFLPLIAAVTFELQRLFARYCSTGPLRALLWPGFLVQKITTIEPDDEQLEVALASLRATLFRQELGQSYELNDDVSFPTYEALLRADRLRPALA